MTVKKEKNVKENEIVREVVPERTVSFEQYAQKRGIPRHHFGGRKAYVQNADVPRTLLEWDEAFKGY